MKSTIVTSAIALISVLHVYGDSSVSPIATLPSGTVTINQQSGEAKLSINVSGPPISDFFGTTVFWRAVLELQSGFAISIH